MVKGKRKVAKKRVRAEFPTDLIADRAKTAEVVAAMIALVTLIGFGAVVKYLYIMPVGVLRGIYFLLNLGLGSEKAGDNVFDGTDEYCKCFSVWDGVGVGVGVKQNGPIPAKVGDIVISSAGQMGGAGGVSKASPPWSQFVLAVVVRVQLQRLTAKRQGNIGNVLHAVMRAQNEFFPPKPIEDAVRVMEEDSTISSCFAMSTAYIHDATTKDTPEANAAMEEAVREFLCALHARATERIRKVDIATALEATANEATHIAFVAASQAPTGNLEEDVSMEAATETLIQTAVVAEGEAEEARNAVLDDVSWVDTSSDESEGVQEGPNHDGFVPPPLPADEPIVRGVVLDRVQRARSDPPGVDLDRVRRARSDPQRARGYMTRLVQVMSATGALPTEALRAVQRVVDVVAEIPIGPAPPPPAEQALAVSRKRASSSSGSAKVKQVRQSDNRRKRGASALVNGVPDTVVETLLRLGVAHPDEFLVARQFRNVNDALRSGDIAELRALYDEYHRGAVRARQRSQ